MPKISELPTAGSAADADELAANQAGTTRKVTRSQLLSSTVPSTRAVNSGTGLTGGGTLSADRTLSLNITGLAAAGSAADADELAANQAGTTRKVTRAQLLSSAAPATRTITTGVGLSGGGNLTADRTLNLDIDELSVAAAVDGTADYVAIHDADAGAVRKTLLNNLPGGGGGGSGATIGAGTLAGRATSAGSGVYQQITLGSGLSMSGSVLSSSAAATADYINVKSHGAVGNGSTNDLPALQAAYSAAQAAGKNLYLPPGIYRITDTWEWGGPAYYDYNSFWVNDSDINAAGKYGLQDNNPTYNGTNFTTATRAQKVAIIGAGDGTTVIWGNFANPGSGVKPIIMDWQAFSYQDGGSLWPGARMNSGGFSIMGNDNSVSTMGPPHRVNFLFNTTPANRQVGIFSIRSQMGLRDITFIDLHVGLIRQDCYWSRNTNMYVKNCTYGFSFWQHNAGYVDNLHGWANRNNTRFLRCSGVASTYRDLSTQQYDTDIHIVWGSGVTFSGCYFENVFSTAGYSIRCGSTSGGGPAVINCAFRGGWNGRTSRKEFQFWQTYDCCVSNWRIQATPVATEIVFDQNSFVRGYAWDWVNGAVTPASGKTVANHIYSWGRGVGTLIDGLNSA